MKTPYSLEVEEAFLASEAERFGDAHTTAAEYGALRKLIEDADLNREEVIEFITEHGYPMPDEITPEMVALTGAAHACGVAIHLAETRGIEGKDATYESYTIKNRFDRFTSLHLPKTLREAWNQPIDRAELNPKVVYPEGADITKVPGIAKPSRYLPAQTMRNLEFARFRDLDDASMEAMKIDPNTDPQIFDIKWEDLVETIEAATDVIELAGDIGAEVGRRLLANGVETETVAAILKKSYSVRGAKEEHGDIEEADQVLASLLSSLAKNPETAEVAKLIENGNG